MARDVLSWLRYNETVMSWKLHGLSKKSVAIIGIVSLVVIGYADYITGNELALSAFYLLPISLVVLKLGRFLGIGTAIISAIIETWVHVLWVGGFYYSKVFIHFWNMGILMTIYIVIASIIIAKCL